MNAGNPFRGAVRFRQSAAVDVAGADKVDRDAGHESRIARCHGDLELRA